MDEEGDKEAFSSSKTDLSIVDMMNSAVIVSVFERLWILKR
jgi:hypothetical protein